MSSSYRLYKILLVGLTSSFLFGCRLDINLGLVDDADFQFVNNTDRTMTFFIKNGSESGNVFDDKFEITSVNVQRISNEIRYRWNENNSRNQIASQDTNSRLIGQSLTRTLRNNRNYWVVSWLLNQSNYRLSLFERQSNDTPDEFQVRIFANRELQITIDSQNNDNTFTQAGEVSPHYSLAQCNDLSVGGIEIDLCQTGEIGRSYLVVVDNNGQVVIGQE